jgi:hypothetical protein
VTTVTTRATRSPLRAVAVPTEHGGWGLTGEPILLGLLVAPSVAGLAIGLAALLAFVARTPLRVVLVDRHRHRHLERTRLAVRVLTVEILTIATLAALAVVTADAPFWWPALVVAPLVAIELWFDQRSRSRRLIPELAGAVGISAVTAMVVLAAGGDPLLAAGAAAVPAARAVTSIVHVRDQIARLHLRPVRPRAGVVADVIAVVVATGAVVVDHRLAAGALAVAAVIVWQRLGARRPVPAAKILGLRQLALGLAVVVATAAGVHLI